MSTELSLCNFHELILQYRCVLLDSYGVLKNHRGLIPGVPDMIAYLRENGIRFRVLTNDASRSQQQQSAAFERIGLHDIAPEEIVTSGMMAKQFLANKFSTGKVAYLGTPQAAQYILEAELEAIPIAEVDPDTITDLRAVVFLDDEGYDWCSSINTAINLLRKHSIPSIVANSDRIYPVAKNDVALATGGIARLVESVLGREFIHFGKPDSQMFMHAYAELNAEAPVDRKDMLMVGDTLHTDILGGNKFGIATCLVFSGNTRQDTAQLRIHSTGVVPDFACESVAT